MQYQKIGKSTIEASKVALGFMRISDKTNAEAKEVIKTALDSGINFFDHADIYGGNGKSELVFTRAIKELNVDRKDYYLQSKVGIRPGVDYNFDKDYILDSVANILERLETDYLDSLLLHRPDILWEPDKIAEAFTILKSSGKVRYFGVSNMNQHQVSYLQSKLDFPLITNQLQLSIKHHGMLSNGIYVNTDRDMVGLDAVGIMDYMREHEITVQAWSPFQVSNFKGLFFDDKKYPKLNEKLDKLAKKYDTSKTTLAVAWILRHPAKIQTIIGTMTPSRIVECANATEIDLSRKDWYAILDAAGAPII